MSNRTYLILLVDRVKAELFTLFNGSVGNRKNIKRDEVPQGVKHGDDVWDAQDKIMRHIENHLHRHLLHVSEAVKDYSTRNKIDRIIIGSHKPLFAKIEKHLPYPLNRKLGGRFVTELKAPFNEVLARAMKVISQAERKRGVKIA